MHRLLMSGGYYSEFRSRYGRKFGGAVRELDAYIYEEEIRLGGIIISDEIQGFRSKITRSLTDLKAALKRDKTEKEEAYEYLKKSNETMKKIMEQLQGEMRLCGKKIRCEFVNFENLNTERLLSIDPRDFATSTARGK